MYRIRFILTGAVFGIAWACSLRGFMQQLADADSTFTFAGTFGVIIPAGVIVGALLGWAEYQRRAGRQHRLLITFLAPKPSPDLSVTTAHGAWFCTLAASLYACLALASSIPMYRPAASRNEVGPTPAVPDRIRG